MVALDPANGSLKWRVKPAQAARFEDVDAPILTDESNVYVTTYAGATFALNREDGATIWKFDKGGVQGMASGERLIFLASQDRYLYGIDKTNGEAKWTFACKRSGKLTRPVMIKGRIAIACSYGHVHIIDPGDGHEEKTLYAPGTINSPLSLIEGRLMAFTGKGYLVAFTYP